MKEINSINEILQDNFFIEFIGKIIDKFKNEEAKIALGKVIIEFSAIFLYEAYVFMKEKKWIDKDKFFINEDMKDKVMNEREFVKKIIKNSNYIKGLNNIMGIDFDEETYDINIVCNNKLIMLNFPKFLKDRETNFWESCLKTNNIMANEIMKKLSFFNEEQCNCIINTFIDKKKSL